MPFNPERLHATTNNLDLALLILEIRGVFTAHETAMAALASRAGVNISEELKAMRDQNTQLRKLFNDLFEWKDD